MATALAVVPQEIHAGDGITHCACGCGESLEGKDSRAKYVHATHRTAHWKVLNEDPAVRRRRRQRQAKAEARARGPIKSDIRVSFDKALETVAHRMWLNGPAGFTREHAEAQAWWALREALPGRLRDYV